MLDQKSIPLNASVSFLKSSHLPTVLEHCAEPPVSGTSIVPAMPVKPPRELGAADGKGADGKRPSLFRRRTMLSDNAVTRSLCSIRYDAASQCGVVAMIRRRKPLFRSASSTNRMSPADCTMRRCLRARKSRVVSRPVAAGWSLRMTQTIRSFASSREWTDFECLMSALTAKSMALASRARMVSDGARCWTVSAMPGACS